jgi:hypothetical protein
MRTLPSYLTAAFLFLGLLHCEHVSAQEKLRWDLQKGEKFTLQMKQQTDSLVNLSSKKLNSTVDLQVNVGWEVTSAEAETFVIEQTIDSIRIEMKGVGQDPVIYDSREKIALVGAAKEFAGAVSGLLGAKFKITMTPQGAITAAERVTPPAADAVPAGEAGKAAAMSKEAVEKLLSHPLLPLPKEPTESWTDERRTKAALGDVTLKRTFTLAGSEDRAGKPAHKIAVKGDLEIAPTAAAAKGAPKLKTQTHSGTAWFAKEPGRLLAAETTQRLVTESQYRDSTITVDLTTTLSTTLTPRE